MRDRRERYDMYARQPLEAEREEAERLAEQLSALAEAAESLTFTAGHEALLEMVARSALRAFPFAGRCAVFIYDEKADELAPGAAIGYDLEALSAVRLKPGQGVAGKVFAMGRPIIGSTPQQVAQHVEGLPDRMSRSLLAACHGQMAACVTGLPLNTRGQTIGCLILECIEEPYAFSEADERILHAFASYMAVVLENARLMRETSQAMALEEANRAKTEFLSYVTHELHTPLAAIKIAAETLMLSFGPREASSPKARLGSIVVRNIGHLERLLQDMLSMTRLQTGTLELSRELLDIREVVVDTVESLRGLALAKRQSLRVALPSNMPLVSVDRARLSQIVVNLLVNASKHTPRKGSIKIAAREEDTALVMSVSDTGPGIPKEAHERIFEKFYRLPGARRRDQASLGLGLPIAKALVELHGGRIWLESESGKGSTFFVSIPKVVTQDEGADR